MNTTKLAALVAAVLAFSVVSTAAEKARELPYAAGNPNGGVPLWNPGEQFVAVSGGACSGSCPVYDLYLFSDGKVIFSGRKFTNKTGVLTKMISPETYASLLTLIVNTDVLDKKLKRGSCLSGRSMLMVMRSTPDGQRMRVRDLNSGCEGHADLARDIETRFIEDTEIQNWLVPKK
ncbi:MAG TPA: DUF6438 domain-containing protein [Steroidobacteraceae bacterium]|nr:DUF6438 domain-containing protein [Steroidobacteraceae bacterium]